MSNKPMGHLRIWTESLISAIPVALAIEWKDIQKKYFNRQPHFLERFLVILFGTALTLYVFSYVFKLV